MAWLQRLERSGLCAADFARRHGLGLSTLMRWKAQQHLVPTPATSAPLLREVNLRQILGQPQWLAEVQRPDGLTVRLSAAGLPLLETLLTAPSC